MLSACPGRWTVAVEFLETFYTQFVPIFLFTVMVAMGLSLTVNDLKAVVEKPKALLTGLTAQMLALPAIGIGMGLLLDSPPIIAAGAIILTACPGGITSNAYVFASRADIALSIGLTTVASVITVFSVPFFTLLALNMHLDRSDIPTLPAGQMMWTLRTADDRAGRAWHDLSCFQTGRRTEADRTAAGRDPGCAHHHRGDRHDHGLGYDRRKPVDGRRVLMTAINVTAMTVGFILGKLAKLPFPQRASITFEVGVQNLSMALFVAFTFLQTPELAIATLVYALVMKITAMSLVWYVRNQLGTPAPAVSG